MNVLNVVLEVDVISCYTVQCTMYGTCTVYNVRYMYSVHSNVPDNDVTCWIIAVRTVFVNNRKIYFVFGIFSCYCYLYWNYYYRKMNANDKGKAQESDVTFPNPPSDR